MRCPVCEVGILHSRSAGLKRTSLASMCREPVRGADLLRKRGCDWCAAEVVTSERIMGLITPPREDRIEELERAKARERPIGLRASRR